MCMYNPPGNLNTAAAFSSNVLPVTRTAAQCSGIAASSAMTTAEAPRLLLESSPVDAHDTIPGRMSIVIFSSMCFCAALLVIAVKLVAARRHQPTVACATDNLTQELPLESVTLV